MSSSLAADRLAWVGQIVQGLAYTPPDEAGLWLVEDDFSLASGVGPNVGAATVDYVQNLTDRYRYLCDNKARAGRALREEIAAIESRLGSGA